MNDLDHEPIPEFSNDDLDRIFEEAKAAVENLHESIAEAAEDAGYARHVITSSYPRYTVLFEKSRNDPSMYPIVASGLDLLQKTTIQYNHLAGIAGEIKYILSSSSDTTGTFAGSTNAALELGEIKAHFEPLPGIQPRKSRDEYIAKLSEIDDSLGNEYKEVWQTFFGTSADPHRAALFMMRQVYDHFFSCIAPDDSVRESPYWSIKAGDKPNQIYRSERIRFAAHNNIEDTELADVLAASAKHINDLNEAANNAHKRGALNEDGAEKTIVAMDDMLKTWINAVF